MKNACVLAAALAFLGCGKKVETKDTVDPGQPVVSDTRWSQKTELFIEYPPLVAGQTSRFAIHVTRLDTFKPLPAGKVEVQLGSRIFAASQSGPGIFGADVRPESAGRYVLTLRVSGGGLSDTHDLGEAVVHATARQHAGEGGHEGEIAFLKEQQWTLEFATEVARERRMRDSLTVPAQVLPRTGGVAEVTVPFEGRLVAYSMPGLGAGVRKGQVLAQLLPPVERPAGRISLELARTEADTALQLARRDRARAERLVSAGAAPVRRRDEARAAERTAEARLAAAQTQLAQYDANRDAAEEPENGRTFALRAPIGGVIAETRATSGANVKAGDMLFRIVDTATVYIAGSVPEADLPRLRQLSGAELRIPGMEAGMPAGRLVSVGRLVDPHTRTVAVVYETGNRAGRLAIGQALSLRLFTTALRTAPAVPESAVVDDSGRPIVYLQVAGESFARRPVQLGHREGGYVQILEGVTAGERVVTRGANLIRLASLSPRAPGGGHVH
ncbi:MAG: efflux RND transporter periplasmic adaptor subunit [Acidobacteria bacterium]|nr:efflux RND transporter periplasmic adaptor subunit [Acidobacteriota bacterium]